MGNNNSISTGLILLTPTVYTSPVDIELLFPILYNITALHHNTNIFSIKIM